MGEAKRRRDYISRRNAGRQLDPLAFAVLAALGGYRGQLAGPPSLSY